MKQKSDKFPKWLIAFLIVEAILVLYTLVVMIMFFRIIEVPTEPYSNEEYNQVLNLLNSDYEQSTPQRTDDEYKRVIEEQLGLSMYIYTEKDLGNSTDGITHILVRLITIDSTIEGYEYCLAFTHEALHLKTCSKNETYICTETFKFLYENEDEELHNIGVWYARQQLMDLYIGEYNIKNYIINYIIGEEGSN